MIVKKILIVFVFPLEGISPQTQSTLVRRIGKLESRVATELTSVCGLF